MLKSWGLNVQLGRNLYAEDNQFAGNDDLRFQDLQQALNDPHVDMIWCARGGYGTVRLIDRINWDLFEQPTDQSLDCKAHTRYMEQNTYEY